MGRIYFASDSWDRRERSVGAESDMADRPLVNVLEIKKDDILRRGTTMWGWCIAAWSLDVNRWVRVTTWNAYKTRKEAEADLRNVRAECKKGPERFRNFEVRRSKIIARTKIITYSNYSKSHICVCCDYANPPPSRDAVPTMTYAHYVKRKDGKWTNPNSGVGFDA